MESGNKYINEYLKKLFRFIFKNFDNIYPSAIFKGWRPLSIKLEAYSNKDPAKTTTPVVPSPISLS